MGLTFGSPTGPGTVHSAPTEEELAVMIEHRRPRVIQASLSCEFYWRGQPTPCGLMLRFEWISPLGNRSTTYEARTFDGRHVCASLHKGQVLASLERYLYDQEQEALLASQSPT